jgi:hypothetical protein
MILSIGENIGFSFNNILESNTKYLFCFEYDLCYDGLDDEAVINAGQANDEDKFIETFNTYKEKNGIPDKIVKVLNMTSPDSGWPNVIIQTTKPMTVKEYADYLDKVYAYGGAAGPNRSAIDMLREYGINVVKICT